MKLYTSPTTPFGRKIAMLIAEKGLGAQIETVLVAGTALDVGTMPIAHNPLGKIPVLVLNDGTALHDSRVISRFLDDHFDLNIYPKGADLWPALAREAAIDGIIEAAVLMAYEVRLRPEEMRFAPWVEGQWAKIARALDMFEADWPVRCCEMEQIALATALGYLDFRQSARNWRENRPKLAAWHHEYATRPAYLATVPIA
jgi:glutathione S-transferase